jgi:hypothetical protein
MTTKDTLSGLSNDELLSEVKRLAASERQATADLIRSLAEVEARRLHLALGCSSMFGYCTQLLHLSEHAAYARIAAARASTRFPIVMDLLIEGAITLTTVTLLGRHLTADNHAALLESARHKSKADVEMLVATLQRSPTSAPRSESCRRRIARSPQSPLSPCSRAPATFRQRTRRRSMRLRRSCRTLHGDGRPAIPSPSSFADGGPTTADNLELRCPAHNAYEAELWSGALFVRETPFTWVSTEAPSAKVGRTWSRPSFYARRAWSRWELRD